MIMRAVCHEVCRTFRADTRRSESFHTFLIMGEFSDLIGLQSEIGRKRTLVTVWTEV